MTVATPLGYGAATSYGGFSITAAGMVAYRSGASSRTQLTWFDRTGQATGAVGEPDENNLGYPELSPDDRRVAVDRTVQGNTDIWLIDLLRGGASRFTFDAAIDRRSLWSFDDTQILFNSNRKNTFDLYTKPSSGSGVEQLLFESPTSKVPYGWSSDGQFLLYGEDSPKTARDLWAQPMSGAREAQARQRAATNNASPAQSASAIARGLQAGRSQEKHEGDRKPITVVNSPFDERNGQVSPDGRWVAYHSNESVRSEVYVVTFPIGGGKWQISTGGGISPRWRHDGKELFFIAPDG